MPLVDKISSSYYGYYACRVLVRTCAGTLAAVDGHLIGAAVDCEGRHWSNKVDILCEIGIESARVPNSVVMVFI